MLVSVALAADLPAGPFERELAPGLILSAHAPPQVPPATPPYATPPSDLGAVDDRLWVVRVDPGRWELDLWSSLDPARSVPELTGPEFAARFGLTVAFNPGMYEPDSRATGYTRAGAFLAQAQVRRNAMYRSWFVAGPGLDVIDLVPPKGAGTYGPAAELADPRLAAHRLVAQSLPILRDGAAAYPPRDRLWSELCYGVDSRGWLVVVFSRYPYEMRELGARVAALGLGITDLVHGEGGPEAMLVVKAGGADLVLVGSYETAFSGGGNAQAWVLPTVMGVRPRSTE